MMFEFYSVHYDVLKVFLMHNLVMFVHRYKAYASIPKLRILKKYDSFLDLKINSL